MPRHDAIDQLLDLSLTGKIQARRFRVGPALANGSRDLLRTCEVDVGDDREPLGGGELVAQGAAQSRKLHRSQSRQAVRVCA